jgi:two-component system nitrate/nitrite response regulator NarL
MARDDPHTRQIRVLIAESQPLFRDGLARSVHRDSGLRLVAELSGTSDIVDVIRRSAPDVAVVEADPGVCQLVEAVAQHQLGSRIMLLAAEVRSDDVFAAVAAGAHGYLSKRVKAETACDAIRRVADGNVVLCEEAQTLVAGEIRLRHADEHRLLAPRELEVLTLLQVGLNNREIGSRLHIAPTTVKSHCARLYERLGVRDRTSAVVEGMRRGLLE